MNKTVEQWLRELPEPFREQALRNMHPDEANEEAGWMSEAIDLSCVWDQTDEGWDYWNDLREYYLRLEGDRYIAKEQSTPLSP